MKIHTTSKTLLAFVTAGFLQLFSFSAFQLFSPSAFAQTSLGAESLPTVTATGEATIKVVPDLIEIRLGVEVRDPSLETATRIHKEKMAAIISALRAAGVLEKDIQTDYIGIAPWYPGGYSTKEANFFVQKSVVCVIRNIAIFEKALKDAIAAGATHVHGIDFRTSELRKYRDMARMNAIKAAREKADLLTGALGAKAGKPVSIGENIWGGYWTWRCSLWGWNGSYGGGLSQNISQAFSPDNGGSAGGDTALGRISVSATVTVRFLIE
ncbi:MAG: SIMPL domain-containing protein [Opitutaceae bacterium]|jgi:uncharacterized protein YggE|nr:SIMPL domain-containing protein [Opitutaceae bacterium]